MNIRAEIFGGERGKRQLLKRKQPKRSDSTSLTGVAVAREETRRTNSRDNDRYRLSGQFFKITYHGHDYDAEVVNLSGGGAMVSADLLPNIGERMHLHLGEGGPVECAVRWVKGGRLGLEFAHETQIHCSEDERAAVLREVIKRDFPHMKFVTRPMKDRSETEPERDEQRAAKRHPLIWWADLHHGSHRWHVRLRNISATGALIDCPGYVQEGSEVLLEMGDTGQIAATVSWTVGDHVGLRFDEPFDLARLSQGNPQVTPPKWIRPDYLADEVDAHSAWDPAWARMSVEDLREQLEGFIKR